MRARQAPSFDSAHVWADLIDRLLDDLPPERLWSRALSMMDGFGADWMSVVRTPTDAPGRTTIDTSTSRAFMDEYLGERIYRVDPWVGCCGASHEPTRLDLTNSCGLLQEIRGIRVEDRFIDFMGSHNIRQAVLVPSVSHSHNGGVVLIARSPESEMRLTSPHLYAKAAVAAHVLVACLDREPNAALGFSRHETEGGLSAREREVLQWLAAGLRTKQIAARMGIEPVTVGAHLASVRVKLGARTREQALAIALTQRLITL